MYVKVNVIAHMYTYLTLRVFFLNERERSERLLVSFLSHSISLVRETVLTRPAAEFLFSFFSAF